MIRKLLITIIAVFIVMFLLSTQKSSVISVFRMTEEPIVISKGNYGQSIIVEISFTHEELNTWLQQLNKPYPLLMLDDSWIERSPQTIEIIKKKNIPTGLLGDSGKKGYSIERFKKEVSVYEEYFDQKPLWFMTSDYEFPSELMQEAFKEQINLITPTQVYSDDGFNLEKGTIISIPLHEHSKPDFQKLLNFYNNHQFMSIEENIFGYTIKSKKMP